MAQTLTPEQERLLMNDPELQAIAKQSVGALFTPAGAQPVTGKTGQQRLQELGIDPAQYEIKVDKAGNITGVKPQSWLDKHGETLAKVGAAAGFGLAGAGLASGLAGAGAAAGAGSGASAAAPTAGVSSALGAAGTPAELAALGGNAGMVAGGSAPALAGLGAGAGAAAASGGWASWIPKLATVGAQLYGGINTNKALKNAQAQQQAGTAAATAIQNQALQRSGDIYNQQRADTQNLFGQPFQTLGGLMGLNIAPIGPANGRIPTSTQPTGEPTGLNPNVPMTEPYPGKPGAADPLVGVPVTAGMTLKELAALGSRKKSQTSYGSGAAKERA